MRLLYSFIYFFACFASSLSVGVLPIPNEHAANIKAKFDDYAEHYLLPEDFHNAETAPVKKPTDAEIESMQNSLLFEGDIMGVPEIEKSDILKRLRDDPLVDDDEIFRKPFHSALNLVTYPDKLWPEGQVPYMLEEGMTNDQRTAIAQAFDEYKTKTCVRFVPKTDDDFDYIYVKRNVAFGCSSYVGRAGGNQTVSLEVDKCFSKKSQQQRQKKKKKKLRRNQKIRKHQVLQQPQQQQRNQLQPQLPRHQNQWRDLEIRVKCEDLNAHCGMWEQLGHCQHSVKYMAHYCRKACGLCEVEPTTTTTTKPLPRNKEKENKSSTSSSVTSSTPRTTVTTTTQPKEKCEDKNLFCSYWAKIGECNSESKFMKIFCKASCGKC
ncbi:hypothetical protein CAEBREN_31707 [Caenorhabditis brenneri]|uniref:Metalloendopeptidase n=1 Tax=Caenorhabditis brenneri TaxID=135651 RepID=G0P8S5_CAEBE|nr:hypothetical protein CAEBREN_31707 [Caenorhabditis brenneri]